MDIHVNGNSQIFVVLSEKGGIVRTEGSFSSKAIATAFKKTLERGNENVDGFYCWIDSTELIDATVPVFLHKFFVKQFEDYWEWEYVVSTSPILSKGWREVEEEYETVVSFGFDLGTLEGIYKKPQTSTVI